MPVNLLMTWVPSARRWTKKHNGKWYAVSCRKLGVPETKEASWRAANDWWENQLRTIESAPPTEGELRANAVRVWSMVQDWSVLDEESRERLVDSLVGAGQYKKIKSQADAMLASTQSTPPNRTVKAQVDSWLQLLKSVCQSGQMSEGRYDAYSRIEQICHDLKYVWRECTLDPVTTVYAFLRQVLAGNTACDHVPHLTGLDVTGEAYCKARSRLPGELFQRLMRAVAEALIQSDEAAARWRGHRLWHIDGSGCSMPDTAELQKAFGQPGGQKPGCGFPVAHLMTLFDAGTGFLLRMVTAPLRTHDMSQAQRVHDALQPQDVVIADRGFCSYGHLALLSLAGVFALFRIHQKTIVDFRKGRAHAPPKARGKKGRRETGQPRSRWVRSLGKHDQIVEYYKPQQRPKWMTREDCARLPDSIFVRELRYRVTQRGFRVREVTLVTTLLDAKHYSAADLAKLYQQRWEIETNLRHLKQTLHMDVLRTKTVNGIHKELAMFAIVYNLVRLVMLSSAKRRALPVTRISFIDAQRWLSHAPLSAPPRKLIVLPVRPDRFEPRVRKRRPKEYDLMNKPRRQLKQALIRKQVTS